MSYIASSLTWRLCPRWVRGQEAPWAGTLTSALSLPGRGRSEHMASREKPTLVSHIGEEVRKGVRHRLVLILAPMPSGRGRGEGQRAVGRALAGVILPYASVAVEQ